MARKEDLRIRKAHVKHSTDSVSYENYESEEIAEEARHVAERRSQRKKKPKSKKRWILLGIIIVLVVIVWLRWDIFNPKSIINWVTVSVTGGETGDGYPTEVEGSSILKMDSVGNQLVLLTGNKIDVYNKSAGIAYTRNHSFASPILCTAGNHILIAEMGGTRVQTQTISGTVKETDTEADIVAASIAKNGSFAVATGSSKSYVSEVVFYSKDGVEKLHWYSSDILVMGISLRDDGRKMAVVGVQAKNGAMESRLLVFDTGSNKDPVKYTGTNVMLYQVGFLSNGAIAAVGDTETWTVHTGSEKISKIQYADKKLIGCDFADSQVGLVLQTYGTTSGFTVLAVNKTGNQVYSIDFDEGFQSFSSCPGNRFFVLTDEKVIMCNSNGKTKEKEIESGGLKVHSAFGSNAIVVGLTTMNSYSY